MSQFERLCAVNVIYYKYRRFNKERTVFFKIFGLYKESALTALIV